LSYQGASPGTYSVSIAEAIRWGVEPLWLLAVVGMFAIVSIAEAIRWGVELQFRPTPIQWSWVSIAEAIRWGVEHWDARLYRAGEDVSIAEAIRWGVERVHYGGGAEFTMVSIAEAIRWGVERLDVDSQVIPLMFQSLRRFGGELSKLASRVRLWANSRFNR